MRRLVLKHAPVVFMLALVAFGATPSEAGPGRRPIDPAALHHELVRLKEEHGVTSLLFGLWVGDRAILVDALGTSMTGVPATPEMHFRIGAVSVASLTTVLLQLVEQGVVSLDDPLSKWFPQYPQAEQVTLRMLGDSSSGYRDYEQNETFRKEFYEDVFFDWPTERLIELGMEGGPLYEPGTSWSYAHTNFVLLGKVLAAATGKTVQQLVTENIIERLGLEETRYVTTAELPAPVLHAFTPERGVFEDSTFWSPSWTSYTGGLNADLHDLGRLIRALGSGELVSRKSYRAFTAPTNVGHAGQTRDRYYGLGIEIARPWIVQSFSFGGYSGRAGYLPRKRLTMAVMTTLGEHTDLDTSPADAIFEALRQRITRD